MGARSRLTNMTPCHTVCWPPVLNNTATKLLNTPQQSCCCMRPMRPLTSAATLGTMCTTRHLLHMQWAVHLAPAISAACPSRVAVELDVIVDERLDQDLLASPSACRTAFADGSRIRQPHTHGPCHALLVAVVARIHSNAHHSCSRAVH